MPPILRLTGRREAAFRHCGRHGTRSSCRTSRSETTASLTLAPLAALLRQVATWRQVSRLWPLGRQMTLYELPHMASVLSVVTVGIFSGRGNGRDQFGRDNSVTPDALNTKADRL